MKYLFTTLLIVVLHSVFIPDVALSATDNQLVTEIRTFDNDSTFRYLYMYDNLGNKVLETKYYQQDSTWVRKSLNEWIYAGNNCTSQRERVWTGSSWMMSYSIDYSYTNGLLISEIHNTYSNGTATLFKKVEYQSTAQLNNKKEYAWQSNAWILSFENGFSYNLKGTTDSINTTSYQNGNISDQLISSFVYNTDGTLQSQLLREKTGNVWVNTELINWFYKPNTTLVESIRNKKWNTDTSVWENTQRVDYLYNGQSAVISETCQRWKSMFWDNDVRYDYQYDSNNNLIKKILSQPLYNDWRSMISINYSNFKQNKANTIESQYEFWGGNTGELTTSYIPFMFNNELSIQKGRSIEIGYLPITDTGLNFPSGKNTLQRIPVYPNPSEGIYYINTQTYTINSWTVSDLKGQVLRKEIQSFQSGVIDLTDLPKGIYILRVTTPDQQLIQKLIKE